MGGPGIYPSGFNPTFSPVEFHLSFCTFRADENIKEVSTSYFSTGHGCIISTYDFHLSYTWLRYSCWEDGLFVDLERSSVFWPDSVSFLPRSAVCLRGLSELVEPSVT